MMLFQITKAPQDKILSKQKEFIFENVKSGFNAAFDLKGYFTDIYGKPYQFERFSIELTKVTSKSIGYRATLYESGSSATHTATFTGSYGLNVARGVNFCMGQNCGIEENQYYAAGLTILAYDSADGAKIKFTIYEPAEATAVRDANAKSTVNSCLISEINPNPAAESAQIVFHLPADSKIWLFAYDALGKKVATLYDGATMQKGSNSIDFNLSGLNSGIYYLQLSDGKHQHSVPLIKH